MEIPCLHGVPAQQEHSGDFRMANDRTQEAETNSVRRVELEGPSPALKGSDAAKKFAGGNRRVVVRQSIAAQGVELCRAFFQGGHDAMDAEFAGTAGKNNVPAAWSCRAEGFYGQTVTRIDGGQHTGAASDESYFGESPQSVSDEREFQRIARLRFSVHRDR